MSHSKAMGNSVVTIERHIIDQEREHPEATGAFSNLLYDIALAAKMIAREVRMAGLVDILGAAGQQNASGDEVKKLDMWAHEAMFKALDHTGHLCCMASEESESFMAIPEQFPVGDYALVYDPLDGSSNIDANVSIGTIWSIHRKISTHPRGCEQDVVQIGRKQVAAGYVLYGSATMLVYTTGAGVHGFTLDPSIGEFLLSHPKMRLPSNPQRIYSTNEGNYVNWSDGQRKYIDYLKGVDGRNAKPFSARYIGSLVADLHRTLLYGGIFMYPGDKKNPRGKLRLLYEAAPLGFITEQAGGRASDGENNILDVAPTNLHDRTPLYMGNKEFVEEAERFLAADKRVEVNV
jgi:fructose-1,6-bisphosphatase I